MQRHFVPAPSEKLYLEWMLMTGAIKPWRAGESPPLSNMLLQMMRADRDLFLNRSFEHNAWVAGLRGAEAASGSRARKKPKAKGMRSVAHA